MDIASISALVAAGVTVGVAFAYLEVRSLARQRETDVETRQAEHACIVKRIKRLQCGVVSSISYKNTIRIPSE